MERYGFSIKESVQFGWNSFIKNGGMLCGIYFLYMIINLFFELYSEFVIVDRGLFYFSFLMVKNLIVMLIYMSMVNISLAVYEKEKASLEDIVSCFTWRKIFFGIITILITGFALIFGLLLLIIPGIILAIKLQFAIYFVIRDDLSPIDALHASWDITFKENFRLLGLGIIFLGIEIIGLLCCFIGTVATTPIVMLATVYVFNKLYDQNEAVITRLETMKPEY